MKTKNTYWTIRHGQSENNVLKVSNTHDYNLYHLTDLGREQSKQAGEVLKSEKIDAIYTSPFLRAKETAHIIASTLNTGEVREDERLAELEETNPDAGPVRELTHTWEDSQNSEGSYGELYLRIKSFIDEVESENTDKNMLIVTHATPQNMVDAVLGSYDEEGAKAMFLSVQLNENPFRKNAVAYKAAST